MSTLQSEVVLESQFTTNAEIIGVVCSQEGNLAVYSNSVGDGMPGKPTCFTRELGFSINAIHSNDSRNLAIDSNSVNVVGSSANFTFVTNVNVGSGGSIVVSSPRSISFYVDVGPARAAAGANATAAAAAAIVVLNISFYLVCLLAEWLPADERGIDNSPYTFVRFMAKG